MTFPRRSRYSTSVLAQFLLVLFAGTAFESLAAPLFRSDGSTPRHRIVQLAESVRAERGSSDRFAIEVDSGELARLWDRGSAIVPGFPLPGGLDVDLELLAFELTSPNAVYVEGRADGDVPFTPHPMRFFRGGAIGDPDSLAYLWIAEGRIGGFVSLGGPDPGDRRLFLFGPKDHRFERPESREHEVSTALGASKERGA